MAALDFDALQNELKKKRICRFCLSQDFSKLTNIYMRDTRIKTSAPLPIQIMAIASIEIFSNDGMPSFVCSDCTDIFEYSYQFKQMCKKADNLIRQYPLTGKWPNELEKPIHQHLKPAPRLLQTKQKYRANIPVQQQPQAVAAAKFVPQESLLLPKKILNAAPVTTPEPPVPLRTKLEKMDDDCSITFLDKIENNDELSIDDIQQLVASEGAAESEFLNIESLPVVVVDSGNKTSKPKLLNKSSVRILNKEAAREREPRLSLPKVKKDLDGNMEIVAEILEEDEPYEHEPDPKKAEVIETNVFPCPHCERSFPLLQLRDIHLKNHTRDRKFQCDECDKCFFSKYDLQRHSFIHNGEKPHKCSACDKAFSRSSLLTRHEKTHTDIPKYICIHCERAFLSKEDLDKHVERHNINRPFQCKLCNKGFAFKQGLERHEVIHSRQQPYSCQYCDQSFSTTTKLARHLTAHAGERPYPCKFCKKSYLLSHHLTRHLRSHTNIDNGNNLISFMCMSCDASFESRDELIRHSTTHANEENLACPLCKELFENFEDLTSHIQDHSDGEAYACEFCDLIFMAPEKLQIHTDDEHAKEMEAYYEDDRNQADKKLEAARRHGLNESDEKLQQTIDSFLIDELYEEPNETVNSIKQEVTTDHDEHSPKIIKQIIIKSPENQQNVENQVGENRNSLLIPLKQRKLDSSIKQEDTTKAQQQTKQSPQLRRKTPAAASAASSAKGLIREPNQPTIQSLLRLPKDLTITKAPPLPTAIEAGGATTTATAMPNPAIVKIEQNPSGSNDNAAGKMKVGQRKVRVQKITVTKAEAAAMAKDGRIKIKDGKIILNK